VIVDFMRSLSKKALIGYPAGIITGITYGLNPLFGMPLMNNGAAIESILFFRYSFAVVILGVFLWLSRQSFKISLKQAGVLLVLGLLYTASSIFLFEAYNYIASGLATTLIFLYPVLVAVIMVFLGVVPSWPVWLAIAATFGGVLIMTQGSGSESIDPVGVLLSLGSALVYALFIVIINRSKVIADISNSLLTFYSLLTGAVIFLGKILTEDTGITTGIEGIAAWGNLIGLAILPTVVSTATLAVSTRNIGATKASVLGVFEPITAILVGTLVFGEALTANIVVGILIAIVAVTFMIVSTKR
jgi:drug/metabolite transporter (DMT)-like permease